MGVKSCPKRSTLAEGFIEGRVGLSADNLSF